MSAREKIIQAAMELFWLKGYNSTSIADLLSRTQLNSGSLYHVFPSKQDVLIGVLEAYRDGIEAMLLEPAWGAVDDPIEKIFALLNRYRTLAEAEQRRAEIRAQETPPTSEWKEPPRYELV